MSNPLAHATVVLTGASTLLGEAFASRLAEQASTLALVGDGPAHALEQQAASLEDGRPGLVVRALSCDLSHPGDLASLMRRVSTELPPVGIWVHAATHGVPAGLDGTTWEHLERLLQLDVRALARLAHAWVPGMVARRSGGLLWVGSIAALLPWGRAPIHAAAQHFQEGLAASLRVQVAGTGVTVTQVCPGPVAHETLWKEGLTAREGHPGWHRWVVSPEQVVSDALTGFAKGRSRVVPGFALRQAVRLATLVPRPLRLAFLEAASARRRAARESQQLPARMALPLLH